MLLLVAVLTVLVAVTATAGAAVVCCTVTLSLAAEAERSFFVGLAGTTSSSVSLFAFSSAHLRFTDDLLALTSVSLSARVSHSGFIELVARVTRRDEVAVATGVSDVSVDMVAAAAWAAAALAALIEAADFRVLRLRVSGTASRLFLWFSSLFFFNSAFKRWKRGEDEEGGADLVGGAMADMKGWFGKPDGCTWVA